MAMLPTVAVQSGKQDDVAEENVPMKFTANEIFIRCNDAVFSGSQIRGKELYAIVCALVRYKFNTAEGNFECANSPSNLSILVDKI